jgi:PPOX class probable F420-dependent enzyme
MIEDWVLDALRSARVGRLATSGAGGAVGLVPICFAVLDGWIVSAVDHKPKRTARLRRLDDMTHTGRATVLVDHYDDEDWSRLWWVRITGSAVVHDAGWPVAVDALVAKYPQYRRHRPTGAVYGVAMDEVRSWRATPGRAR